MRTQYSNQRTGKMLVLAFFAMLLGALAVLAFPQPVMHAAPNAQASNFQVLKEVFGRPPGVPFNVGDTITYTIHITNTSLTDATSGPTTVTDLLPPGLTLNPASGGMGFVCTSSGPPNNITVTCTTPETMTVASGTQNFLNLHLVLNVICSVPAGFNNSAVFTNALFYPAPGLTATDPTTEFTLGSPPCAPAATNTPTATSTATSTATATATATSAATSTATATATRTSTATATATAVASATATSTPTVIRATTATPTRTPIRVGAPPVSSAPPAEVPEADTLLLFGGGIGGLATWLRWRKSKLKAK